MPGFYVGWLPDDQWRPLLSYVLDQADSYRVHVPEGPGGQLSYGREQFKALPESSVTPWSGMRDALEIAGELSPGARELFATMENSLASFNPTEKLWDYQLLRRGDVLLRIGDYHDLLLYPTYADLSHLRFRGVVTDAWHPLSEQR
ncbi:MAG TPA: hypothetical protein VGE11_03645 [Pseudonocardia sp.]